MKAPKVMRVEHNFEAGVKDRLLQKLPEREVKLCVV